MATTDAFDPAAEAQRIAFDRTGKGEKILLLSGFPQTRRSWNKMIPLLSPHFETIAADLPSFGDSGVLPVPATTDNAARVFHEFVAGLGVPLHVVAHDFGAWVAYSWALLFPADFRTLTLIDAGIPGVTLTNDVQLDWQAVRTDGCTKLDVRIVLRTDDGALIVMTYQALRHEPPNVMDKLEKGELVDPASYYFRMTPLFATSAQKYDWINRIKWVSPSLTQPKPLP
jgi:pimeloyl-ACP methyl ester carboxylesterase